MIKYIPSKIYWPHGNNSDNCYSALMVYTAGITRSRQFSCLNLGDHHLGENVQLKLVNDTDDLCACVYNIFGTFVL